MSRCCGGDQRAHVAAAGAVTGDELADAVLDLLHEVVGDGVDGEQGRDRHAALAGGTEAGVDRSVRREVEVGVRQHEHVVLRAAEGLHPLAVRGAGLVDVLGDRGGADERDGLDLGVGQQRVDGLLVTVHDAQHAVGQAGLLPQRGDGVDGRRVLLAGLDDHGVAAGDGDRHEPQRHHGREVERADDGHDAQALPDRVDVDLGRGVLGEAALHQVRDAAGELGDLEATGDLTEGVGEDLAVLGGDQRGDVLLALVEQLAEPEEHLGALGQRDAAPAGGPGLVRGGDDLVDEVGRGEVELAALHAGGGVEDRAGALGGALPRERR